MTKDELNIRSAVPDDSDRLTDIALASKRYWKYPEDWITRWKSALTITENYLNDHQVVVGEVDQRVIGFYALTEANGSWDLDHFWIHPDFMSRGFGRTLFHHLISYIASLGHNATLEIESDPHAEAFYLRMGAVRVGSTTTNWNGLMRTLPVLRYST